MSAASMTERLKALERRIFEAVNHLEAAEAELRELELHNEHRLVRDARGKLARAGGGLRAIHQRHRPRGGFDA